MAALLRRISLLLVPLLAALWHSRSAEIDPI